MSKVTALSSRATTNVKTRFALLDLLRFIAALAVVGYHLVAFKSAWGIEAATDIFPKIGEIARFGALGVDLFFIISGFVILASANGRTIQQFAVSRVSRIFPAFWVAALLTVPLYLYLRSDWQEIDLVRVLMNLTMTQTGSDVSSLDGVYWTLWSELRFYILIAFFIRWGITPQRILAVATIWPILASMSITYESKLLSQVLIAQDAALFAGGMMVYFIYKYGWSATAGLVLALNVFTACHKTFASRGGAMNRYTGTELSSNEIAVVVLLCFVLVLLVVLTPLRGINAPWMTWLGLFTYPLYLVHEVWGWWIIKLFKDTHSAYYTLGVALAFVFTLAFLLLKLVDQPGGRWLKKQLDKDFAKINQLAVSEKAEQQAKKKHNVGSASGERAPSEATVESMGQLEPRHIKPSDNLVV